MVTTGQVHVAGEVTTSGLRGHPDDRPGHRARASATTRRPRASTARPAASTWRSARSRRTSRRASTTAYEARTHSDEEIDDALDRQGAGDQGLMFGYACTDTPELMPLPIALAHRLARGLTAVRKSGAVPYLRPDGKTQVTIEYVGDRPVRLDTVVVSSQHAENIDLEQLLAVDVREQVVEPELAALDIDTSGYRLLVNPTGRFVIGGPMGDAGLTGRKIIVDTYGGMARHGGGAFSGKDPSKVDRSAAYAMRWVAKNAVAAGLAERIEVQVAYAIGKASPVGLFVETFGTEQVDPEKIADAIRQVFDLRPAAIIRDLDLQAPDLRADRRLRPLRPHRRRPAVGEHRPRRRPEVGCWASDPAPLGSAPIICARRGTNVASVGTGVHIVAVRAGSCAADARVRLPACVASRPGATERVARRLTVASDIHSVSMTAAAPPRPRAARAAGRRRAGRRPGAGAADAAGRPGAGRRAAGAPRPAVRLPRRRAGQRRGPSRACGCGCGSPAGWSTGYVLERLAESDHQGRLGLPRAGGVGGAGADARGRRSSPGRSPTGTRGRWPTCCGSRCRPRHARVEAERRAGSGREATAPPTIRVRGAERRTGRWAPARRRHRAGRRRRRWQPSAADRADAYPAGPAFLGGGRARGGRAARGLAGAARRGLAGPAGPRGRGRRPTPGAGALLIVPDARDLRRLELPR